MDRLSTVWAVTLCLAAAGRAQSPDSKAAFPVEDVGYAHYLKVFAGQSLLILGTEDRRQMAGFEYGYAKPDPRLAFAGYPAQLVSELKFDYSRASGDYPSDPSSDMALGAIFYAHYEWPWHATRGVYIDWGGGAESLQHTSHDLPLSFDGALLFGAGYFVPLPHSSDRLLLGLRYFHISNAGRKYPNFGQNQLQATIGLRL